MMDLLSVANDQDVNREVALTSHRINWTDQPLFLSPANAYFPERSDLYNEFIAQRTDDLLVTNFEGSSIPSEPLRFIGVSRVHYLVGMNKWLMPLNEDNEDITPQDFLPSTTHHIISCPDGILAACRTVHNPEATSIDQLEFLATRELNGANLLDNLPTVNEELKRRALLDEGFSNAITDGAVATIERLIPTVLTSFLSAGNRKLNLALAQASIGSVAISSAAYLKNKGVSHVIIQADDRYRRHYQETLGIPEEGIICKRIHSLSDGTPDPCYTMILDLNKAEDFTRTHNPSVYSFYMQEVQNYQTI